MNICRFVPPYKSPDVISTLNFVCEYGESVNKGPFLLSYYRICLVTKGKGCLNFDRSSMELRENDVFLIFPSVEYTLECSEDFTFMYISFIGLRVSALISRFGITKKQCVFSEMAHVKFFWEQQFACQNSFLDLVSESLVLYTFSEIGQKLSLKTETITLTKTVDSMFHVRKFIDERFSDSELCLDVVSKHFKYNKKYLSHQFKLFFGMGINEYINFLRINYACTLIEQKHRFVQEVSFSCGYKDPLYFSRVFKKITGVSPREMIKSKK